VLRRDPLKLGRVQNLLQTQAYQQKMRKQFDENDASVGMDKKDLKELEKGEPAAASSKEVKSGRVEKKPRKKKNGQ
jgi:transcription initiation factor TFIID subunit 13